MNRPNPSSDAYVPSMMSFVGLEANTQKHPLWEWEPATVTPQPPTATAFPAHSPFFPGAAFLDCPPAPLLPASNFPCFYSPTPAPADYSLGLIKREVDALGLGMGSGGGGIGLNLGHRTYFSSGDAFAIDRLFARSRGLYALGHHQPPRCQAEGCKADLSGAKHYHRRHKVCELHSKAPVVRAAGLQQRFCQQCSRFHVLSEFDENKRSCRKRLADHNRRRRKAQLPASSSKDPSASSKKPTTNSTEKSKQTTPKPTMKSASTAIATTKSTTTAGSNACVRLEGQQAHQNKTTQLRSGSALSQGAVEKLGDMGSGPLYHSNGASIPPIVEEEEEVSVAQQQLLFSATSHSNSTYFHHHNLFCSNLTEGSHSNGGGISEPTGANPTIITAINNSGGGLLHLGQATFEVDFM